MNTTLAAASRSRAPRKNNPARSVTQKRVHAVRFSWFVLGSLFGVGVSFLMNLFVTSVVLPKYDSLIARQQGGSVQIAAASHKNSADEKIIPNTEYTSVYKDPIGPIQPVYPRSVDLVVDKGDTLLNMLVAESVNYDEAVDVVDALRKTYNPRQLRIGQNIAVNLDKHPALSGKATVSELNIQVTKLNSVKLEKLPTGAFFVSNVAKETKTERVYAGGTITNSLFQTGYDNGVPDGVLAELVKAYSYDVDFQREIHSGDQMEVLFDKKVTEEGDAVGYGNIYYAKLRLRGKDKKIFRHEAKDGTVGFYDENGESIIKALLRTPINGARISSGFGMRRHPVLGYSKMHRGTDFAAVTGTPIYAAGDGVIATRGWVGGYGNYIKVKHTSEYSTAYGHMSRFAKGMGVGSKVKQGQVIGYVGSTGRSTGPHLHYEVHKHGQQVNPINQKFKTGNKLQGTELANFRAKVSELNTQMAAMPKSGTRLASNAQ